MIDAKTALSITKDGIGRSATRSDLETPTMQKVLSEIESRIRFFASIGARTAMVDYNNMFTEYGNPEYGRSGLVSAICEYLGELGYKAKDECFSGKCGLFWGLKITW